MKDLLVELQAYIAALERFGVLALKDNFWDGYFSYVLEDVQEYDGKIFLAKRCRVVSGVIICKILQGIGEAEFTTRCSKSSLSAILW